MWLRSSKTVSGNPGVNDTLNKMDLSTGENGNSCFEGSHGR
jgi:hypothetical protein